MELMEVQIKMSGYMPSTDPDPTGRSPVSRALRYNSAINEIVSGNCSLNTVTHTLYNITITYVLPTLHNLDQA